MIMLESAKMNLAKPKRPGSALSTMLCVVLSFAVHSALAGQLLVVSGGNSTLPAMDKTQVRNIFLGKVSTLPDGQAAVPVDQPEASPLREEFYLKVADCSAAEAKARWAQLAFTGRGEPPRVASGSGDVKRIVNATPGAIGYIEKSELDDSVKVLFRIE